MMPGSDGAVDLEYTPPLAVSAKPVREAALDQELRKLQNTVAHQAEEMHLQRNAITALTARVYALEQEMKSR